METTITFAGAVTGSRFVLDTPGFRLLIDCGLDLGEHELEARSWQPFPVPADSIDAVVLTHAHIDHAGYLPRLLSDGFQGRVYATPATRDLCALLLPDAAALMEEEAEYRHRKGATRFHPALPLYTSEQALAAVRRIEPLRRAQSHDLSGVSVTLSNAGHLPGSAIVRVETGGFSLVFSSALGRQAPLLYPPPAPVRQADYLLLDARYGGRRHDNRDPQIALEQVVRRAIQYRGVVLVPAVAVGCAQELLFLLRELQDAGRIPRLPIAVDSPRAADITALLLRHAEELNPRARVAGPRAFRPERLRFTQTPAESKSLNQRAEAAIIIAGAAMATGGRVLHHLRRRLPNPRNFVLLADYQAPGTRGRQLADGARSVRIFGEDVPVRAEIVQMDSLSAHADGEEIIAWLRHFEQPPRRTFLVHGEDAARTALARRIREALGWEVAIPHFGERAVLG